MPLPIARPFFGAEERQAVDEVLASGMVAMGPRVERFEAALAGYLGRRHVVATSSCTGALQIALLALDIGPGDEVITTPLSWVATANAIVYTGARPVFADVEPDTLNISPEKVKAAITSRTRAILPVHLFGNPADMKGLRDIAREYNVRLVGDCAHALESMENGAGTGTAADCFSFWGWKNLSTGEGGGVATDNQEMDRRLRSLRAFGLAGGGRTGSGAYTQETLGWKYVMSDIQAAIGLVQLGRLDSRYSCRVRRARRYYEALGNLCLPARPGVRHSYHIFPILLPAGVDRARFRDHLAAQGISTGLHYQCIHLQPYYRVMYGCQSGTMPVAEAASERLVSLPFWPEMTFEEQDQVIAAVKEALDA